MHEPGYQRASHEEVLRIVLIYAVFAGLWIVLSDWALERLIADMAFLHVVQTLKGWLFVGITSLLLYYLLNGIQRSTPTEASLHHNGLVDWPRWQLYLFALAMPFVSLLIRENIAVSFEERPLLLLFMFPIILSAALGGIGPGTVSTLISAMLVAWFTMPPTGSLHIERFYDLFQLGFLVGDGLLISFLSRMMHDARHRAVIEKHRAESLLSEKSRTLQLLNSIARNSTDAIFAMDVEGRFILFNPGTERITGKKASEMLGRDERAVFPPEVAARLIANNRMVMQENKTVTFEDELVPTDGGRTLLTTKGPLHDAEGKVVGVFGIARDISAIKSVEAALRRERDRNQRYLDSARTFMLALDGEGRVSMINRYGCELLGYRESEMIGQNWFRHYLPQPEGMEVTCALFQQMLSGKLEGAEYHENEVLCRDGSRRLIAWHNANFRNEVGNIMGTLSSGEDITER
ncbi:MAG: PAS domain S-box protein, partial [Gammaproteobacteria bacterium]|nr:PAS domain S-box protein [Gammaproteobacteria bacterium]